MKRRSKLSLAPDDKVHKQHPPGFEDAAADDTAPKPAIEAGTTGAKQQTNTRTSNKIRTRSKPSAKRLLAGSVGAKIDRKKLIKVVAMVAVSAGALYLLKRRFLR